MVSRKPVPKHTREVFAYLKDCAGRMRTVYHDEIADNSGRKFPARAIGGRLGYIRDDICKPRGLPLLNVIAVNKKSWKPEDGYYGMPDLNGIPSRMQERLWRGMVLQVFAYDWSHVNFDE